MDILLDRQASLASSKSISTSYTGFCIYFGIYNAQLIGLCIQFLIESGKTLFEADATEADATEADATEADATEADATEADATEADATEVLG
jgi:uncharacterized protein YjbI with pentapeptide repeats